MPLDRQTVGYIAFLCSRMRFFGVALFIALMLCGATRMALASDDDGLVILVPLFPGEFDNTKYAISPIDPDGIAFVEVTTSLGESLLGGEPPCLTTFTSGTVTILPDRYPVRWIVTDCLGNTVTGEIQCPERQCSSTPEALLDNLMDQVQIIASPASGPLAALLREASRTLAKGKATPAVKQLKAAVHLVDAQEGKNLTQEQATTIRSSIIRILGLLTSASGGRDAQLEPGRLGRS